MRTLLPTPLLCVLALAHVIGTPSGVSATEALSPVALGTAPIYEQPTPWGDISYTPGRGLRVGRTGLTIGGYTNAILAMPEGEPGKLEVDPVSLLVAWDPLPRLHVMSEIQYDDAFEIDERGRTGSADDDLTVERLYADLAFSDLFNVRAGVFLTPVGRWNVIHIAPLVWTTEQPLVTEELFDPSLTGVMLHGSLFAEHGMLRYAIYDQFAGPIEGNPEFDAADHSVGARLDYTADAGWSVGASYLASRRDRTWQHLGGLDLLWKTGRFELMGELAVREGGGDAEWGGYLQSAYALTPRVSLVQRFEHYAFSSPDPSVNLITLGLVFRPWPAVVLKTEYLIADRRNPEAEPGLYSSVAVLF